VLTKRAPINLIVIKKVKIGEANDNAIMQLKAGKIVDRAVFNFWH
jgi:hypothetical protein